MSPKINNYSPIMCCLLCILILFLMWFLITEIGDIFSSCCLEPNYIIISSLQPNDRKLRKTGSNLKKKSTNTLYKQSCNKRSLNYNFSVLLNELVNFYTKYVRLNFSVTLHTF